MNNLFFDLDGTILNSSLRLYNLFVELCSQARFTYDEYWSVKRNKVTQKALLKKYFDYSDKKCDDFHEKWLKEIERKDRLNEDILYDGIKELLYHLSLANKNIYIVTNRQSKELTLKQLETLGIKIYFNKILVTEQIKTKQELIKENVIYTNNDYFITDTGDDIKEARKINIKTIAVTWGTLNKNILSEYKPDYMFNSVLELSDFLLK